MMSCTRTSRLTSLQQTACRNRLPVRFLCPCRTLPTPHPGNKSPGIRQSGRVRYLPFHVSPFFFGEGRKQVAQVRFWLWLFDCVRTRRLSSNVLADAVLKIMMHLSRIFFIIIKPSVFSFFGCGSSPITRVVIKKKMAAEYGTTLGIFCPFPFHGVQKVARKQRPDGISFVHFVMKLMAFLKTLNARWQDFNWKISPLPLPYLSWVVFQVDAG
ncbi:hypothetical protein NPIL_303861 [Nephila pilipes]|uniref:Uncharacterized protein n=1 Tax=Nephila pilipes TaxID=299642 RepID=A0A8X6TCQ9_NEPPI|nr:hypothetical protein NPIL_303861 [Nephila pilipes]